MGSLLCCLGKGERRRQRENSCTSISAANYNSKRDSFGSNSSEGTHIVGTYGYMRVANAQREGASARPFYEDATLHDSTSLGSPVSETETGGRIDYDCGSYNVDGDFATSGLTDRYDTYTSPHSSKSGPGDGYSFREDEQSSDFVRCEENGSFQQVQIGEEEREGEGAQVSLFKIIAFDPRAGGTGGGGGGDNGGGNDKK